MKFKNIFRSNIDEYHRASPCRPVRRFIAALIDFFILTAVSLILYLATYQVTIRIDGYQELANKVADEVEYYKGFIKETHLVEYFENQDGVEMRADTEEVAIKILLRNLKYSYNHDKNNDFYTQYDIPEKLKGYDETTLQNDNILYFLSEYLPLHNENNQILDMKGMSAPRFYRDCIEKAAGIPFYQETFTQEGENEIVYIKPYVANKIIGFLYYDVETSDAQSYYNNVLTTYINIINDLETIMLQSPDYQLNHYQPYEAAKQAQAGYIAVSMIVNLAISYLLAIVLPQILFKDGRTFARKIFNIGVISRKLGEVRWYQILGRCIFGFFGMFPSLYLIPIIPIFNFEYYTFNVPFATLGKLNINVGLFILVFGIITVVSGILVPILKKRTTLVELATQTYVVDGRILDEIDYEEPHYAGK